MDGRRRRASAFRVSIGAPGSVADVEGFFVFVPKKEPFAVGFAIRASHFDGVAVNAVTTACAGVAVHNFRTGVESHGVADGGNGAAGHGVAAVGEGAIRRKKRMQPAGCILGCAALRGRRGS